MKKINKIVITILCFFISIAWFGETDIESYMPLKEGSIWEYEALNFKNDNVTRKSRLTVINMSPRDFDGENVIPVKYVWKVKEIGDPTSNTFYFYFFVKTNNSIYSIAKQMEKDIEPKKLNTPLTYLKNPIKKDNKWKDVNAESTIEGIEDTVTVPAGSFKCVRVKQSLDNGDIITVWYAKDIGRIKQLYQSKENLLIQLLEYKK